MASSSSCCSTVTMAAAIPSLAKRATPPPNKLFLMKPLMNNTQLPSKATRWFQVKASSSSSIKEKAVTGGLTAAAITASMMIPDVAEAAESGGVSPSLKNFLLSILAGGVVLAAILGAIIAVSNFDPVKRS